MKYAILIFAFLPFISCERNRYDCFDENITHNNPCTTDCPGVCGCDGQIYCNECEANRNGITVVGAPPCN